MKKKEIIKDIFLFLILFVLIGLKIFLKPIGDLDEIWNYNFANCISKGLIPYKDFNIVQTPLLSIITGLLLFITKNELFVMRILATLLCGSILFFIYKILECSKVNKKLNLLSVFFIYCLHNSYFCIDYNYFSIFLSLFTIFLELKNNDEKKKYNFCIGIVVGLIVITKQNIGLFVCIACIISKIIIMLYEKKSIKDVFTLVLFRTFGIGLVGAIFILYLLINNAFFDFWDYAVLGIFTFSNKISYLSLIKSSNILIKVFSIIFPLFFIINPIIAFIKKDKKLFIFWIYSLASFIIAFPISDNIHFLIGSILSLISIIYLINEIIKNITINKKSIIRYVLDYLYFICILFIVIINISIASGNFEQIEKISNLNHFHYIPISDEFEKYICELDNFIQNNNKKVYILNFDAAIYMIPIDRYNKNYDMFLKGNLGSKGEEGQIENIIKEDALYMIVSDDMHRNWQNPENVRKYIKDNLNKVDERLNYYIYEN